MQYYTKTPNPAQRCYNAIVISTLNASLF